MAFFSVSPKPRGGGFLKQARKIAAIAPARHFQAVCRKIRNQLVHKAVERFGIVLSLVQTALNAENQCLKLAQMQLFMLAAVHFVQAFPAWGAEIDRHDFPKKYNGFRTAALSCRPNVKNRRPLRRRLPSLKGSPVFRGFQHIFAPRRGSMHEYVQYKLPAQLRKSRRVRLKG